MEAEVIDYHIKNSKFLETNRFFDLFNSIGNGEEEKLFFKAYINDMKMDDLCEFIDNIGFNKFLYLIEKSNVFLTSDKLKMLGCYDHSRSQLIMEISKLSIYANDLNNKIILLESKNGQLEILINHLYEQIETLKSTQNLKVY